jgi:hypothetical protein
MYCSFVIVAYKPVDQNAIMEQVFSTPLVELWVSCKDLHKDGVFIPKLFATVYRATSAPVVNKSTIWKSLGDSERIRNLNPSFITTWTIEWDLVIDTWIRIEIHVKEKISKTIKLLGYIETKMSGICNAQDSIIVLPLVYVERRTWFKPIFRNHDNETHGSIEITGDLVNDPEKTKENLTLEYTGTNITKMDLFSKSGNSKLPLANNLRPLFYTL